MLLALGVVLVDQATKTWALGALQGRSIPIVDGYLRLHLARNTGAAFSAFSAFANSGPVLAVVVAGVIVLIVVVLRDAGHRMEAIALGFVLGGAVGNFLDRLLRGATLLGGAVVDWIDPSFFPTFNVADSAITVGVALLLLGSFLRR